MELLEGEFPRINTELFSEKQKIGVMKSHLGKFGLAILKADKTLSNNVFIIDKDKSKFKII